MKMATLGQAGLRVSRAGLGLPAPGRPGFVDLGHADGLGRTDAVAAMRARASAVLDAARI